MSTVNIEFVLSDGSTVSLSGEEGETLLNLKFKYPALANLEFACEGAIACTTCHVIVDEPHFPMTGGISDDENDMLDLAYGLSKTSRLGCQVRLTQQLEGAVFTIPRKNRS